MKHASKTPHPIPYQGSKRGLASAILAHFPPHADRLVEPFAGSAAISLATAQQGLVDQFWINDAHEPLIALWNEIVDRPEAIAKKYERLWTEQQGRERAYFDTVRDSFNRSRRPEHFLYLLARCVKAAIRYNGKGEFNNTPDNRRKGARPSEMAARIHGASLLLRGRSTLTATDYVSVLENCTKRDLIYMDPPYQGVCKARDNRYAPKVSHDEFRKVLAALNGSGFMYMVSYDGRTGAKNYGRPLPKSLGLEHFELCAGRSTQSTLLGKDCVTYESLYLSPALADAIRSNKNTGERLRQMTLV